MTAIDTLKERIRETDVDPRLIHPETVPINQLAIMLALVELLERKPPRYAVIDPARPPGGSITNVSIPPPELTGGDPLATPPPKE